MITRPYLLWYAALFVASFLGLLAIDAVRGGIETGDVVFALVFAAVFPVLWIWLMRKLGYPVGRPISCPRCGTEMPMVRMPASTKQAVWGGYTCPNCGAEMDGRGREISPGSKA